MKKVLLSLTALLLGFAVVRAQTSACAVTAMQVEIKSTTAVTGGCEVLMDVSFTGTFTNGAKYGVIHLWESDPVNNYPNLNYNVSTPPGGTALQNALGTIVIEDPGSSTYSLVQNYPWPGVNQPAVKMVFDGVTLTRTGAGPYVYTLENVKLVLSTCGQPVTVRGDVWGSNNGNNTQCNNQGAITILFNNLQVNGIKQCVQPRLLNLAFQNVDDNAFDITTRVFIDDGDGIAELGTDDIEITGSLNPALPGTISLSAGEQEVYLNIAYSPYNSQGIYDKPIWVEAVASAPNAASVTTVRKIDFLGTCALLPVEFKSFDAKRINAGTVELNWATSTELNNKGFTVERKLGNGAWTEIGFVATKAVDGNSNTELTYSFQDANPTRAVSQYRLVQTDWDGRNSLSVVRAVKGEAGKSKLLIYPNPSDNGRVTVVFENSSEVRDVMLIDMSGRVIRNWSKLNGNVHQIENLTPGFYSLKVTNVETGEVSVDKIVVSK